MTNLMEFHYEGRRVRTVTVNGEPWFVARDVCEVLDLGNVGQAVSRLDADEKATIPSNIISNDVGGRAPIIVSEAGLYALILGSRKPEARQFKRWVTHDVLPSIRKHGMYATPDLLNDPEHLLRVTERLVEEHRARLAAEAQVKALAPKAEFYDRVAEAENAQSIRDVAKVLGTGQNRMFAWLRGQRILMDDNRPYQEYIDRGYFRVIEQTWTDSDGNTHLSPKTLVTGKGLIWLQQRFQSGGDPPELRVIR